MGAFIYRTENVAVGTAVTTFTHGLGVAPAGMNGTVRITMRTSTGVVYVSASSSQIVVLQSSLNAAAIDLEVQIYHSLIV